MGDRRPRRSRATAARHRRHGLQSPPCRRVAGRASGGPSVHRRRWRKSAPKGKARSPESKPGSKKKTTTVRARKPPAANRKAAANGRSAAKRKRKVPSANSTLPQGTQPKPVLRAASSVRSNQVTSSDQLPSRPKTVARATQLDWNDSSRHERSLDELVERWARRGDELLRRLTQHGAEQHEYRADLREGRFVWISPDGRVSAEARAQVVCSWSRSTSVVAMAWTDPLVRASAIPRIDGMPSERDDVDEERAWRVAMEAAEASDRRFPLPGADPARVVLPRPARAQLLARSCLVHPRNAGRPRPARAGGHPASDRVTRRAGRGRARAADRNRQRALAPRRVRLPRHRLGRAAGAHRPRIAHLAGMVPRASYGTIAAGRPSDDWIDRDLAVDLIHSITLLEDEWNAFA